jgi:isopentenyl phosphate kinase
VRALAHGLIPLVNGDVAFDTNRGACILSTESIFTFLAPVLQPSRILLAGAEAGVFSDYPKNTSLVTQVSQDALRDRKVEGAAEVDVTGGMAEKVRAALGWSKADPNIDVRIFSGEVGGQLNAARGSSGDTGRPVRRRRLMALFRTPRSPSFQPLRCAPGCCARGTIGGRKGSPLPDG